jgi:hypothetical protein
MKKMLDAGCWMLDAGKRLLTQHSAYSIQHPASSSEESYMSLCDTQKQCKSVFSFQFSVLGEIRTEN